MITRTKSGTNTIRLLLLLFPLLLVLAAPLQSLANGSASIEYQSVSQNKVVFMVKVKSPAPSSLIIKHFHPANNNLLTSSPRARQINNDRGYSKWLLKNVRPGVYPFSLTFAKPVNPGDLRLSLQYRSPSSGNFQEVTTRP